MYALASCHENDVSTYAPAPKRANIMAWYQQMYGQNTDPVAGFALRVAAAERGMILLEQKKEASAA